MYVYKLLLFCEVSKKRLLALVERKCWVQGRGNDMERVWFLLQPAFVAHRDEHVNA
jgi:hypothetical protein